MGLSACLIVKNEEAVLGQCLSSLRAVCEELIVVDTGSDDGTIHLARSFGARVFEYPWSNDFSAARNFSLEQATQTWILICDADEMIDPGDYPELRRIKCERNVDGYEVTNRSYLTSPNVAIMDKLPVPNKSTYVTGREYPYYYDYANMLRLFRNDARIRYAGRIHETVNQAFIDHSLLTAKSSVVIHHFGKLFPDREEAKRLLYLQLAEERYREDPQSQKSCFDYAIQLFVADKFEESRHILRTILQRWPNCNEMVHVYLGRCLCLLGRLTEAVQILEKALCTSPNNPLILCELGDAYRRLERLSDAARIFSRAIEAGTTLPTPYLTLSNLAWSKGKKEESIRLLGRCIELDPNNGELLEAHAARLISTNRHEEAIAYCQRLLKLPLREDSYRWFIFLSLYYHQSNDLEKSRHAIEQGLAAYPNHPRLRMLQLQLGPGSLAKSEGIWKKVT